MTEWVLKNAEDEELIDSVRGPVPPVGAEFTIQNSDGVGWSIWRADKHHYHVTHNRDINTARHTSMTVMATMVLEDGVAPLFEKKKETELEPDDPHETCRMLTRHAIEEREEARGKLRRHGFDFAEWLRNQVGTIRHMLATAGPDAVVNMLAEVSENGDWRPDLERRRRNASGPVCEHESCLAWHCSLTAKTGKELEGDDLSAECERLRRALFERGHTDECYSGEAKECDCPLAVLDPEQARKFPPPQKPGKYEPKTNGRS